MHHAVVKIVDRERGSESEVEVEWEGQRQRPKKAAAAAAAPTETAPLSAALRNVKVVVGRLACYSYLLLRALPRPLPPSPYYSSSSSCSSEVVSLMSLQPVAVAAAADRSRQKKPSWLEFHYQRNALPSSLLCLSLISLLFHSHCLRQLACLFGSIANEWYKSNVLKQYIKWRRRRDDVVYVALWAAVCEN